MDAEFSPEEFNEEAQRLANNISLDYYLTDQGIPMPSDSVSAVQNFLKQDIGVERRNFSIEFRSNIFSECPDDNPIYESPLSGRGPANFLQLICQLHKKCLVECFFSDQMLSLALFSVFPALKSAFLMGKVGEKRLKHQEFADLVEIKLNKILNADTTKLLAYQFSDVEQLKGIKKLFPNDAPDKEIKAAPKRAVSAGAPTSVTAKIGGEKRKPQASHR